MQNRGAIKVFAIAFALVCLFQLSFTFFSRGVERDAKEYANNEEAKSLAGKLAKGHELMENFYIDSIGKAREKFYLDSMSDQVIFNILVRKYTFMDCKERELNLGLDLKGGMNVTLEVKVVDIVKALSGYSKNKTFNQAIDMALEKQKNSQEDFVSLFAESFNEADPNAKLAAIFNTVELKDRINYNSTNDEVVTVIREETENAIDRSYEILRTRIDRFGVAQPNIQRLGQSGRILVELPGIKDPERVRKLLQGSAKLEFWETYKFNEVYEFFAQANRKLADRQAELEAETTTPETDTPETTAEEGSLLEELESDTTAQMNEGDQWKKSNPLFSVLQPNFVPSENGQYYPGSSALVGRSDIKDTAKVNYMLRNVQTLLPRDLRLTWTVKPESYAPNMLELVALKITTRDGQAPLSGDVIVDARQDYDQNGRVEVSMSMNSEGGKAWKRLTGDNIGRQVAIVLDNYIYSYPNVNSEIPNGRSSISGGSMSIEEAKDLANILKAGKLPAPARIVQEEVVGPSLGKEAIDAGLRSMVLAFILVLIYMIIYYAKAGLVADLAMVTNIFFLFGVLASLGAVLTLPGIAGIVLTLGMSVDANVIIYERIKEEVRAGKGLRLAISDGYKNAYSAIIDGNITTLLTGIVLYVFGSGPVQGFATTLIIGILSSLFSAIFISRLIFTWQLNKERKVTFGTKRTINAFTHINIDFISKRKTFYIVSAVVITLGLVSLFTKGLNQGVDFSGGRTYVVRFDKDVSTQDLRKSLEVQFEGAPEVKTFGPSKQVKITTKYLIDDNSIESDAKVEAKLYEGVKDFYSNPISYQDFSSDKDDKLIGRLSSQKVGPTIADDIRQKAIYAVLISLLVIFVYIAARFRKWQYGLGGVITLIHDSLIAISMYSVFYGILPFNLEVDQAFIAAILTIIGYSINDTVIIFDRIREYTNLFPKRSLGDNINGAINSTLGRTFMTSGTTLLVLLVIFFFGGEVIMGFAFALIVGVIVGTYSSVFISTPVAYDLTANKEAAIRPKK